MEVVEFDPVKASTDRFIYLEKESQSGSWKDIMPHTYPNIKNRLKKRNE